MSGPRGRCGERGSTAPLVIGFFAVVLLLVGAVVDASAAYLQRQRLDTLADGAALQGADLGAQGTTVYAEGLEDDRDLRVSRAEAQRAVDDFLRESGATRDLPGLRADVRVEDRRVVVELSAPLDLPIEVPGATRRAVIGATGSAAVDPDL